MVSDVEETEILAVRFRPQTYSDDRRSGGCCGEDRPDSLAGCPLELPAQVGSADIQLEDALLPAATLMGWILDS